jgi:hypothetical protein
VQNNSDDIEPAWVGEVIARLEAAGYTVTCKYDGDGDNWKNKKYTVTKGIITYLLDGRAQELLRISIT